MIKEILIRLFKYELSNYRFGRKLIGGKWFLMRTALPMAPIWSKKEFKSCQAICINTETHE